MGLEKTIHVIILKLKIFILGSIYGLATAIMNEKGLWEVNTLKFDAMWLN